MPSFRAMLVRCAAVPSLVAATVVGTLSTSVGLMFFQLYHDKPSTFADAAQAVAFIAQIAVVPIFLVGLVYGVPVYALLARMRAANVGTSVLIGLFPGVIDALWFEPHTDRAILLGGICAAVTYHIVHRRISSLGKSQLSAQVRQR
jgi:hypothetical protein